MFKGGANMSKLLKQAQKMKSDMDKAQKELGNMRISVSDSNNMISMELDGNKNMISLKYEFWILVIKILIFLYLFYFEH